MSLPKPLGITIEKVPGANTVAIVAVRGNAEENGIMTGDALVGMGSLFGDAIWPVPTEADAVERIEQHISLIDGEVPLQLERGGAREKCEEVELECDVFFDSSGFAEGKSDEDMKGLWGSIYDDDYYTGDGSIENPNEEDTFDASETFSPIFAGEADRDAVFGDGELPKTEGVTEDRSEAKPKKKGWFG